MADGQASGSKVVVAVSSNYACKDAIKWAVANRIRGPDDTLVFLHVVSKIPSPSKHKLGTVLLALLIAVSIACQDLCGREILAG